MIDSAAKFVPAPEPFITPTTTPAPVEPGILNHVIDWVGTPGNAMTVVAVALAGLLAVSVLRRRGKPGTARTADDLTATDRAITRVTALIATAVVALGMWQFFNDVIQVHWSVRIVLFSFMEMGIIAATRRAARHLHRHGDLGTAPRAVFLLASVSATLAAVHADSLDLRLFRVFAAGVASYMWIEELREQRDILHHRNPGKYPPVKKVVDWRRVGVLLGLVEPASLTIGEVATQRRIDRLSRLLNHFHAVTADVRPGRVKRWYVALLTRRVVRRTQAACKYINLAEDATVRSMLLRRLSVVRGIVDATRPDAGRGADAWADVTVVTAADGDARRHIIDVDVTPAAPSPTVPAAADAPTLTRAVTDARDAVTVTKPTLTPVADADAPTVTADAVTVTETVTSDAAPADVTAVTPTVRRTVTPRRPSADVKVRPLSRDLIDERFRDWTVEQVREFAAGKARQVVDGGGTKKDGMKVFLLLCMALGVDPAGKWMAEAIGGAESAARTNKPEWLAELAVADAEQILLAEHNRIIAELTAGGDVRG